MATASGGDNTTGLVKKENGFSPDDEDEPVNTDEALWTVCIKKIVATEGSQTPTRTNEIG